MSKMTSWEIKTQKCKQEYYFDQTTNEKVVLAKGCGTVSQGISHTESQSDGSTVTLWKCGNCGTYHPHLGLLAKNEEAVKDQKRHRVSRTERGDGE